MVADRVIRPNDWLNGFGRNSTSQTGEDGIIEKALEVIVDNNRWCVEFGAWDGRHLSNTHNLIVNKGYSAVLIEGDSGRCRDLQRNFADKGDVVAINAFVGFSKQDGLDALLAATKIPVDFDVLSIDIDGNDYHVWNAVQHYRPKIVVIEYNPTIPNPVEFVQSADMRVMQGSSILSLQRLAKQKGYELVAATRLNAIFVDAKYFDLFGIKDNSVDAIRTDQSSVTYIFNGYDGTVFVRGLSQLGWHSIPYNERKLQQVPRCLRQFPGNYGSIKKGLATIYRYWCKRDGVARRCLGRGDAKHPAEKNVSTSCVRSGR